jgi:hypothetical protein
LLVKAGLLVPDGYDDVAVRPGDVDDVPVSLFWSDKLGGLSAFSPTAGPVLVPTDQLIRRRVAVAGALAMMTANLDLPSCGRPDGRVAGLAWELGEVRVGGRPHRHSIWFARRLGDRVVQRQVEAALAARPHPRLRVLLTSSRAERLDGLTLPGTSIVPVRDVLGTPDSLGVSDEILAARISGVTPSQHDSLVQLSEDGTTLVINGGEPMMFKSPAHIAALRKLVTAFHAGQRVRAADLTGLRGLDRLFGPKRWKELSAFIKSKNGAWGFEP